MALLHKVVLCCCFIFHKETFFLLGIAKEELKLYLTLMGIFQGRSDPISNLRGKYFGIEMQILRVACAEMPLCFAIIQLNHTTTTNCADDGEM